MDLVNSQQAAAKQEAQILAEKRRRNDARYSRTLDAICERYGQDFTDVGDEIDVETGEIVINRGHIQGMQDERDIGLSERSNIRRLLPNYTRPFHEDSESIQYTDNEENEDELPEYEDSVDYDIPSSRRSVRFTHSSGYEDDDEDHLASDEYYLSSRSPKKRHRQVPYVQPEDQVPVDPQLMAAFTPMPPIPEQSLVIPQPNAANPAGTQMIQQFTTSIAQQIASFVNVLVQQQAQPPLIQSNVFIGPNQQHSTYIKYPPKGGSNGADHRSRGSDQAPARSDRVREHEPSLDGPSRLLRPPSKQRVPDVRFHDRSRHSTSRHRNRRDYDDLWDSEEERIMKRRRLNTPGLGSLWGAQSDRSRRRSGQSQNLQGAHSRGQSGRSRHDRVELQDIREASLELGNEDLADESEEAPLIDNWTDTDQGGESGFIDAFDDEDQLEGDTIHGQGREMSSGKLVGPAQAYGQKKPHISKSKEHVRKNLEEDQEEVDLLAEQQVQITQSGRKSHNSFPTPRAVDLLRQQASSASPSDTGSSEELAVPDSNRPALITSSPSSRRFAKGATSQAPADRVTTELDHKVQSDHRSSLTAKSRSSAVESQRKSYRDNSKSAHNKDFTGPRNRAGIPAKDSEPANLPNTQSRARDDRLTRKESRHPTTEVRPRHRDTVPDSDNESIDNLSPAIVRYNKPDDIASSQRSVRLQSPTIPKEKPIVDVQIKTETSSQANASQIASTPLKGILKRPQPEIHVDLTDALIQQIDTDHTPATTSTIVINNSAPETARSLRTRPRVSYVDSFAPADDHESGTEDDFVADVTDTTNNHIQNQHIQSTPLQIQKRPVGRPRKHPFIPPHIASLMPKRPVGRPRKDANPPPRVAFPPVLVAIAPRPVPLAAMPVVEYPRQPEPIIPIHELTPVVKWGLYYNPREVRSGLPGELILNDELTPISTVLTDTKMSLRRLLASYLSLAGTRSRDVEWITETPEDDYIVISDSSTTKAPTSRLRRQSPPIEPSPPAPIAMMQIPQPTSIPVAESRRQQQPLPAVQTPISIPLPIPDRPSANSSSHQPQPTDIEKPRRAIRPLERRFEEPDVLDVVDIASDPVVPVKTPAPDRTKSSLTLASMSTGRATRVQKTRPLQTRRPIAAAARRDSSYDEVDF